MIFKNPICNPQSMHYQNHRVVPEAYAVSNLWKFSEHKRKINEIVDNNFLAYILLLCLTLGKF